MLKTSITGRSSVLRAHRTGDISCKTDLDRRCRMAHTSETTPLLGSNIPVRLQLQPWTLLKQPDYYSAPSQMDSSKPKAEAVEEVKKQNSVVTIFAVWNTMMGTSLLAMPWGIEKAGLALGCLLVISMGALCLYTALSNIRIHSEYGTPNGEISQLAKDLLGKYAEIISKIFSIIVLLGANLVYWILMSNFLFNSVTYARDKIIMLYDENAITTNGTQDSVICPRQISMNQTGNSEESLFDSIWNLEVTVPIFLCVLLAPLLNFKSPTFFTKFNSLGTLSVAYLIIFVITKACIWGINVDPVNKSSVNYSALSSLTFPATSGMLALSYFIHNIIITIMRSNADPKNNGRDLSIAYVLVVLTYLIIGVVFYISFPLAKSCIEDNLLNNFPTGDILTVVGRIFLLFQLMTVFPLISFMLRNDVMLIFTDSIWPGIIPVLLFNSVLITLCILTAIFLPRIGTIIRYTGALSGMVHIFTLPCALRLAVQRKNNDITIPSIIIHVLIPIFGAANLIGQFFIRN